MSPSAPLSATIVITTKNRLDDLRRAVGSALQQRGVSEVLVIDDGSTDGTAEAIAAEFPGVRLIRHQQSRGCVTSRSEAAREARGDIVVSIDDDATFSTPNILEQTIALFDRDRIGAVAIPYVDVNQGPEPRQMAPDGRRAYAAPSFIGTAHALRRRLFLDLGGYRDYIYHQGEESDYAIRMLAAGQVVRLGYGDPIHHFESPRRNFQVMDRFGTRNAVLFAWQNVPFPAVIVHLPVVVWRVLVHTFALGRLGTRVGGIAAGFAGFLKFQRQPVPPRIYSLWRRLRTAATPMTVDEVERLL